MPPINPNALPPRRPIQFENHTPESFGRNGFVNTTPASQAPNPHQAPVDPNFNNTTARDYRPQLRVDTGVANHRPVDRASQGSESPLSDPDRTITAYSDQSGRHAPMHPGLGGSSSGSSANPASLPSTASGESFQARYPHLTPPPPAATPSLSSPGSSATVSPSPVTPRSPWSDDGRIFDPDSPSRFISRSPSMEIPENPFFHPNLAGPISRPVSPDRSTAPSPSTSGGAMSEHSGGTSQSDSPEFRYAPTPRAYHTDSEGATPLLRHSPSELSRAPSPGIWEPAPTPGGYLSSPGSYGYAPTPQAYRSPTPLSNPPTPGNAPTPGGWVSPTPGVEEGAQNLMRLHDSSGHSGASTPRPPAAP